jgi:RNA polymerase sigma-70 factor (sigma-E family)
MQTVMLAAVPRGCVGLVLAMEAARASGVTITDEAERLVVDLYREHGTSLVRLARLYVDDRNAAEDLVQEAFLRLARHAHRIEEQANAPAYLRSIVLNLARDHNRRGLVSLRHQLTSTPEREGPGPADLLVRSEDSQRVIEAVRDLPRRQRDCVTLRYFEELGIADIAATLGLSPNSVKTHLQRGLAELGSALGERS